MKCPICGVGTFEVRHVKKEISFEGVAIVIDDAEILHCPNCGEESHTAEELHRWQQLKQEQLSNLQQAPRAADVEAVRHRFGLSVSELAALLGVTRQAVYGWEDQSKDGVKFGPAALLIQILGADSLLSEQVFAHLYTLAVERGQLRTHLPQAGGATPISPVNAFPTLLARPAGSVFFCTSDGVAA